MKNNCEKCVRVLGLMTCFNRKQKTLSALASLMTGNPQIEFSFIITDDNSTDGTSDALKNFENVHILEGNGELFYTGGMNLAMEKALSRKIGYDYVLLFNDDVKFYEGSIEYLVQKEKNIVWVGPTCNNDGELSYGGIKKQSDFLPRYKKIKADNEVGLLCDTFNANCVLIPWELFVRIGNMDKTYKHSLGDFDYGFKYRRSGILIKVSEKYVGICSNNDVKGTWHDRTLSRKRRLQLKESPKGLPRKEWYYYLQKNYNVFVAGIYSVIPYIKIMLKK